jgi:hypothetical protein
MRYVFSPRPRANLFVVVSSALLSRKTSGCPIAPFAWSFAELWPHRTTGQMVRTGLPAGGNRIRTIGPAPAKGSSGRCQSETAARRAESLKGSGPRQQCLPGMAPHNLSLRGGTASSNPPSSSAESVANLTFGAHSIGEPKVGIQPARSYCAEERGGGTWMRWSFPSPASGCICRVPSITKARSSTYRLTKTA